MIEQKLPGVSDLTKDAFNLYLANWKIILSIAIFPIALSLISIFLPAPPLVGFIFSVVLVIAAILADLALYVALVKGDAAREDVLQAYKDGARIFSSFIWVNVLTTLSAMGGFFLLIIPGLIISIYSSFSTYALISDGRRGLAAMTMSWSHVKGYWWAVFGRILFIGLIIFIFSFILSAIVPGPSGYNFGNLEKRVEPSRAENISSLVAGQIFFVPLWIIYASLVFSGLKKIKFGQSLEAEEQKIRTRLKMFSSLGIFAFIALFLLIAYFIYAMSNLSPGALPSAGAVFPFIQ